MRYANLTVVLCSVSTCTSRSPHYEPHLTQTQVAAQLRKDNWLVLDVVEAAGRDRITVAICPSCVAGQTA